MVRGPHPGLALLSATTRASTWPVPRRGLAVRTGSGLGSHPVHPVPDGVMEMLRQVKVAKDTAVKARTSAMISLKALIVNVQPELREQLQGLARMALIDRCAGLRPGPVDTPLAASKHALRALARRWRVLSAEVKEHEALLERLTRQVAPQLVEAFGVGARHRCGGADRGRGQPRADPHGGRVGEAVRGGTAARVFGHYNQAPVEPGRSPTGQTPRCTGP
jgi:hypothetical protein